MPFSPDATPVFEFEIPKAKKSVNIAPVMEFGTNAKLETVDHTFTIYEYWNGSAWVSGNASLGTAIGTSANVKIRMGVVSATISGTEYWRIKLIPKSFV